MDTKTFIRQKSYSSRFGQPVERLKFAIHLNFHMTSKRHLFLTHSIRVVFSPRRLELDESLKITNSGPTFPKYAAIKKHGGVTAFASSSEFSFLESEHWPSSDHTSRNEVHNGR